MLHSEGIHIIPYYLYERIILFSIKPNNEPIICPECNAENATYVLKQSLWAEYEVREDPNFCFNCGISLLDSEEYDPAKGVLKGFGTLLLVSGIILIAGSIIVMGYIFLQCWLGIDPDCDGGWFIFAAGPACVLGFFLGAIGLLLKR